uniref:Uncharacterized protein n=1 Tax=Anguilla anguilla TaxID=7936 RepID=A0A0E9SBL2_ANGAN
MVLCSPFPIVFFTPSHIAVASVVKLYYLPR